MAHFAQIENGIVQQVIVVSNSDAPDPFPQSEAVGQGFIAHLGIDGHWIQTSYNGQFRRRYAGIGMSYSTEHDAFILPQPYLSWTLDLNNPSDWRAPIPTPTKEGYWYEWDEGEQTWIAQEIEQPAE
jgi:hypothetical protein